ncbi:hypothetical protein [Pseudobythopirellula maris]|uniref:hypothetical protein n=1 Tax=Pseudobythopirellula maris TaxID=2527991 RepID=UPI0011B80668|nr:hypothetical protein [Pseudobythopirellula maris]
MSEPIEIRDERNVVRVRIGFDGRGMPILSLNDEKGRERVLLRVGPEGDGSLELRTSVGHSAVSLHATQDHTAGIHFNVPHAAILSAGVFDRTGEISLRTEQREFSWPDDMPQHEADGLVNQE